ncbi:hypothetical protein IF1G_05899 [Cordyceps javanica]|uniref:Uncharacterized protein n=1 Tax=Cordyceps javanica TaxID=43265 RepID=A0A545UZL2_9HYPO|nr:hypothetical protein IF1G_05899 [Cordyceps javanica]TQW05872.1 hypothetical protein IF2G_06994 [Cordyceps javanica]
MACSSDLARAVLGRHFGPALGGRSAAAGFRANLDVKRKKDKKKAWPKLQFSPSGDPRQDPCHERSSALPPSSYQADGHRLFLICHLTKELMPSEKGQEEYTVAELRPQPICFLLAHLFWGGDLMGPNFGMPSHATQGPGSRKDASCPRPALELRREMLLLALRVAALFIMAE